jgi:hypothetical protein
MGKVSWSIYLNDTQHNYIHLNNAQHKTYAERRILVIMLSIAKLGVVVPYSQPLRLGCKRWKLANTPAYCSGASLNMF